MADPKIDLKKTLDGYRPGRHHHLRTLRIPSARYLMVDGTGDPNGAGFRDAVGALFPVAYAVKFTSKNALGRDYVAPPLEALWWAEDYAHFTTDRDK